MPVVSILYSIQDEKNNSSTMEIKFPDSLDFNNTIEFGRRFAVLIDAAMSGAITRIGVVLGVDISALSIKSSPLADSDVEEGARFQFRTAGGFNTAFRIPTFLESLISPGSKNVDLDDTAVQDIVDAMTDGIDVTLLPGGLITPSDGREDDVIALDFAREQFQGSRS